MFGCYNTFSAEGVFYVWNIIGFFIVKFEDI